MSLNCPYCNGVLGECNSRHLDAVFAEEVMGIEIRRISYECFREIYYYEGDNTPYSEALRHFDLDDVMKGVEKIVKTPNSRSFLDNHEVLRYEATIFYNGEGAGLYEVDISEISTDHKSYRWVRHPIGSSENSDLTIALMLACIEAVRRMKGGTQ